MTWTTYPNPHIPNVFPRRGKMSLLETWHHLVGLGLGGEVPLFDTWNFEEEKIIHHDIHAYIVDTWTLEALACFSNTNDLLKVAKCPLKG
jgi:hypothetical protein